MNCRFLSGQRSTASLLEEKRSDLLFLSISSPAAPLYYYWSANCPPAFSPSCPLTTRAFSCRNMDSSLALLINRIFFLFLTTAWWDPVDLGADSDEELENPEPFSAGLWGTRGWRSFLHSDDDVITMKQGFGQHWEEAWGLLCLAFGCLINGINNVQDQVVDQDMEDVKCLVTLLALCHVHCCSQRSISYSFFLPCPLSRYLFSFLCFISLTLRTMRGTL